MICEMVNGMEMNRKDYLVLVPQGLLNTGLGFKLCS